MSHYHLLLGSPGGPVVSKLEYAEYEDSIADFVNLSKCLFSHLQDDDDQLGFDSALEATEFGFAAGAYVGTDGFCIFWLPCDDCFPTHLN